MTPVSSSRAFWITSLGDRAKTLMKRYLLSSLCGCRCLGTGRRGSQWCERVSRTGRGTAVPSQHSQGLPSLLPADSSCCHLSALLNDECSQERARSTLPVCTQPTFCILYYFFLHQTLRFSIIEVAWLFAWCNCHRVMSHLNRLWTCSTVKNHH